MKTAFLTLTAIAGLALLGLTGCSKNESAGTTTESGGPTADSRRTTTESRGPTLDTAQLQSAFSTASSADKSEVDKAISAIKSGDYSAALASLKQAAANVKLTPEQQSAIKDLMAQVQAKLGSVANDVTKQVGDAAKQAGDAANKTVNDLKK
jgi:hypothetical protein